MSRLVQKVHKPFLIIGASVVLGIRLAALHNRKVDLQHFYSVTTYSDGCRQLQNRSALVKCKKQNAFSEIHL